MKCERELKGSRVTLRCAREDDAEVILSWRLNPAINEFLHPTDADVRAQRSWIRSQQARPGDYYFLIVCPDGGLQGTIGLSNIDAGKKEAEFGRWICPFSSVNAFESLMLIHDFGFQDLGLQRFYSLIMPENKRALIAHERFGYRLCQRIKDKAGKDDTRLEYEIVFKDYRANREERERTFRGMCGRGAIR